MTMGKYEIDISVEQSLEAEAQRTGTSTSDIVSEAVVRHLSYLAEERRIDDEREKEFLSGEFISDGAMDKYMEGLFNNENPTPPTPDVFTK